MSPSTTTANRGSKRRVVFGQPGLNAILPNGIKPGSLIVIAGPPGSGKTLLAMQMLMELQWAHESAPRGKRLFLSGDENPEPLTEQQDEWLLRVGEKLDIRRVSTVLGELRPEVDQLSQIVAKRFQIEIPKRILGAFGEFLRRQDAAKYLADTLDKEYGASQRCAMAVDGILNLEEFCGAMSHERRWALHTLAAKLKEIVSTSDKLAAILTTEVSSFSSHTEEYLSEEFMADVVFQLKIDRPAARKIRRRIEVTKSRYADVIPGAHSLWIVSQEEYRRRRGMAAGVGWSEDSLNAAMHLGVVVFPRLRWRPERGAGPISANLKDGLAELRKALSGSDTGRDLLDNRHLLNLLQRILSGRQLDDTAFDEFIRLADTAGPLVRSMRWPSLTDAPEWKPVKVELPDALKKALKGPETTFKKILEPLKAALEAKTEQAFALAVKECAKTLGWDEPHGEDEARGLCLAFIETLKLLAAKPSATTFSFGIPKLDQMIGEDPVTRKYGLPKGTSTVIVGGPGTGKSSLCYSFMLTGLLKQEDVIFISFDQRMGRVVKEAGQLTVRVGGARTPREQPPWPAQAADTNSDVMAAGGGGQAATSPTVEPNVGSVRHSRAPTCSQSKAPLVEGILAPAPAPATAPPAPNTVTLAEMFTWQLAHHAVEDARFGRLRFIHENPVNLDLDMLVHQIGEEVKALARSEADNPSGTSRPCRLIIDSLSDLQRNIRDALEFNDLLLTLLNRGVDWGVTMMLVYEPDIVTGSEPAGRALSFMADHVISLRHVDVNDVARKCISIEKARGRRHDPSPAELCYIPETSGRFHLTVRKGFEGMHNVLSGKPSPATVQLCLFHENDPEKRCNESWIRDLRERYGDRLQNVPFTLRELRQTFWNREAGRDIRPDADVTIVSLDQPWVRIFGEHAEASTLAAWDPNEADAYQKALVSQQDSYLTHYARRAGENGSMLEPSAGPLYALPHYMDLGLLLERRDVTSTLPPDRRPTHWDRRESAAEHNPKSFEEVVVPLAREYGMHAFAFNMEEVNSTGCTFMEMCWNFFATRDFLVNRKKREHNIRCIREALEFLCRLRWAGALPYPCTLRHCANAIYTRVWYANLPLLLHLNDMVPGRVKPVPFFTSAAQFEKNFEDGEFLLEKVVAELAKVEHAVALAKSWQTGSVETNGREVAAYWSRRQQLKRRRDRLKRRRKELLAVAAGSPMRGWSVAGAWYLGVLGGTGNAHLGWSVIQTALEPERIEERAFAGGGIPISEPFYRKHADAPLPGLPKASFRYLYERLCGRVHSRSEAIGIGPRPTHRVVDVEAVGELPELLYQMVMGVLAEPKPKNLESFRDMLEKLIKGVLNHAGEACRPLS